ncbi:SpoIIE family protein phosphatase [Micromonospora sp. RL09-050-HVF-A]|uniref:SpoIIE family protein phosphatase n=1 Tax=Micromonospora sp. RL09-050-HVF-A TaxID=1703433 RepID=UPI001C5DF781|nr:SpoIIE family protein phosphatase [Micromonospora sp. RL09-050-HVF-A]MBW4701049.1 SpoIIE family protein phosphatase [Micromonospora sp. RL09-050-HVF-A]
MAEAQARRSVFTGTGEMAGRMRALDWSATSLGAVESWPASLRTATRICLTSRFPMIVWWGPELRFLYNDAYGPLLGSKHPALGKPGDQVWAEIWHIIGPMLRGVVETGEATWSEDLLLPMNRHGYWEETYWTYSYSPLHDDDGVVRGVFTAVSDTTERVIGERRLAALQDLGAQAGTARTVGEACDLVVGSLGRSAVDVPYAAVHLRTRGGELRPAASTLAGEVDRSDPTAPPVWPVAEVLATGRPAHVTDVVARIGDLPTGGWQTAPTEAVVLPLHGETGAEDIGVIVLAASAGRALDDGYRTFLDLVARQAAALINGAVAYEVQQQRAEELVELDRAKTAFFSNISHEFRTPLTLISGPLQELRARLGDQDEQVRDELEVMHRNALRLGKLVTALLDFSRIEAGRMQASYEPVDLARFTAELASVFRAAVERAGLTLDVDCPPLSRPVHVDRTMWEKVLLNLLSNALKFTFQGGIRVSVAERDGMPTVQVADTGVGVPADEIPRLFERFHRVPQARSRSHEGSGIGLALVQELVGLHGGTITVDSTPDVGTAFTVRLSYGVAHLPAEHVVTGIGTATPSDTAEPFVQEALRWLPAGDTDDRPAGRPPPADRPGPDRPRVLVADDNADMREYLHRLLRSRYDVTAVGDGLAALARARTDLPDLIVSDVMMPGLDGLELVAALRAEPRTMGVPVLLLSARAGQEAAVEGLEAGADDYLVKPFSAEELLARVRANVDLARLRNHHANWRAAMINSLQEGFFVLDADGALVEMNTAFADLFGYGPEGLPYRPRYPWWPDETTDPSAHRLVADTFSQAMTVTHGSFVVPQRHRDGHRLWTAVAFNAVTDDHGRRLVVGTIRDVTAERYAVQRETALSALNQRLSRAASTTEVLRAGVEELRQLWQAHRVLATHWPAAGTPTVTGTPTTDWAQLPDPVRDTVTALRSQPPLRITIDPATSVRPAGAGTTVDSPQGPLVIWLELDPARGFGTEDQMLLLLLCGALGQALHRAHAADQQREVAVALQRSILGPAELPAGFAVRYEPATRPLEVGGDWYDAVSLPDGRIGIVVGDCVGRGLPAAAVMGQLRSACRALLLEASGPAQVLTALDRFARMLPGASCTTVFCGILDPETGELTYSSAGHPPAILTHPDGRTELLAAGRGSPLGIPSPGGRPDATSVVPPRAVLLLYTDGLVERRRQSLDSGIAQAASAVREHHTAGVQQLADRVMDRMTPQGGYDDIALLLYRHPAPLELSFPADRLQMAPVRSTLRQWLRRTGADPHVAQDVLVATGEACANAVEHGHRDARPGLIRLHAVAAGADLFVTVADSGRWKVPEIDHDRGRGINLMRALMAHVDIRTTDAGTTVELHTRIPA